MDIWSWVERRTDELREAGDERLAYIVNALPSAVVDEAHQAADAMIEEGLARAQELGDAWLEVYFRHWALQSRVLHRNDARRLGDAIEALEFSHRDECRGCPQTTCTVQDVASCYGLVDGAGYARERLAVCDEALAKLTPAWTCFVCISNERIDAMIDAGDVSGAAAFADAQRKQLLAAGDPERECLLNLEEILLRQGKFDEALAWTTQSTDDRDDSESERMKRRLMNGLLYANLGNADAARAALPPLAELADRPGQLPRWLRLATLLAELGMLENTAMLRLDVARAIAVLEQRHIFRLALENAEKLAFLAVAAKRRGPAERALAVMERCLPQLAQPLDAPAKLHAVGHLVGNLTWQPAELTTLGTRLERVALREDAAELLEELESALAIESRTDDATAILVPLAAYYRRLGLSHEAVRVLRGAFAATPSEDLMYQLGNVWLGDGQTAALTEFADQLRLRPETWARAGHHWFAGRLAMAANRYDEARDEFLTAMPLIQPGHGVRTLAAECERRLGHFDVALAMLQTVIDSGAEAGPWDWERMALATMTQRWDVVRESAARLELGVELGDTADHGAGEFCQIAFEGEEYVWDAVRVGPVTARISEIGPHSSTPHFDDLIVFDRLTAKQVGEVPSLGEDGEPLENGELVPVFAFTAIRVLVAGGCFRFAIDGVHPGEAGLGELAACLKKYGARAQDVTDRIGGGDYELTAPDGEALPGIYLVVALPAACDLAAVSREMAAIVGHWPHPLVWPRLAQAAGDVEQIAAQAAAADLYDITE
ncbi:MAG: hypothetical protein IPL79_17665 [Myxococcales bacterium]|nr:hypothetical protein [Myxococcales bacterium]